MAEWKSEMKFEFVASPAKRNVTESDDDDVSEAYHDILEEETGTKTSFVRKHPHHHKEPEPS